MTNTYCFAYGVKSPEALKIGISKNPIARLANLQTGAPHDLRLEWTHRCDTKKAAEELERWLHRRSSNFHMRGEWFNHGALAVLLDFMPSEMHLTPGYKPKFWSEIGFERLCSVRWPGGVRCPSCESDHHQWSQREGIWTCNACAFTFSVFTNTGWENSPLNPDEMIFLWERPEMNLGLFANLAGIDYRKAWAQGEASNYAS